MKSVWWLSVFCLLLSGITNCLAGENAVNPEVIEIQPRDFVSSYLLTEKNQEETKESNYVRGFGEADYAFETPADGWWEFWLSGGNSPFDLILDGDTLIHAQIESGVWKPEGQLNKMINLWVPKGKHILRLSRPQPWGIPFIGKMQLRSAGGIEGKVRTRVLTDMLVRRIGETIPLKLTAGKNTQAEVIRISVIPENSEKAVWTKEINVPAGSGNIEQDVQLPATNEGMFEAAFTDANGSPVDRTIQYLVVDVKNRPAQDTEPTRELVQEIDCATQAPDYASGKTEIVHSPLGTYRETGAKGRIGYNRNADWFAYTVTVPTLDEPYLAEIEYPDDDERVAIVAMIDRKPNPYAPTLGYASGGIYSLTQKMETMDFYFYPREKDMRLFIQTWCTGMKAAMGKVKIYRLSSMPAALKVPDNGRYFGGYQEENVRFTSYYGSDPAKGNSWSNYYKAACRYAENQRFIGGNFWQQTIGNYQQTLWPQKTTVGYGVVDSTGYELEGGPVLPVHPAALDIVRLQLLVCEKYGLGYYGELLMPPNENFKKHMDKQFGGSGSTADNGPQKPWLLYNCRNEHFDNNNSGGGYWNPLYPGVQDWTASMIEELAQRYKDSPAFHGVVLRLASWCFQSWQCFPSIESGYGDYTVTLFEKETGNKVPVDPSDPQRFSKRYAWLMANVKDQWIDWRCQKIYEYHSRLAKILDDARPGTKLVLHTCGPDFSRDYSYADELREKGWGQIIRGTGIDPERCNRNPAIVLQDIPTYPSSRTRAHTPIDCANLRDCNWNKGQYTATANTTNGGSTASVMFSADSYEGEMVESSALGFKEFKNRNVTTIHGAGEVNPAGIHFLDRFAEAMAQGNMTVMASGNHGYDQQQPRYMRPFLMEYRQLPACGMTPVEQDGDPVAVWQGTDQGKHYFYAVNRVDVPVQTILSFSANAKPVRLSTGEKLDCSDGKIRLTIEPYQLLAFTGGSASVKVKTVSSYIPEATAKMVEKQIAFTKDLLESNSDELRVLNLSPVQLQLGMKKLEDANAALKAARLWTARRCLLSTEMTRVYEAFSAYPPELYQKKSPMQPQKSFSAVGLRNSTIPASTPTQVLDGGFVAPELSGRDVFSWHAPEVKVEMTAFTANRFGMEMVCATTDAYTAPAIQIDGAAIDETAFRTEEGNGWVKMFLKQPMALMQGAHKVSFHKQNDTKAGLLYVNFPPAPRELVASDWMAIGPFQGADDPRQKVVLRTMMDTVYPPETERNFSASYSGRNGQTVKWVHPDFAEEFVDLYRAVGDLMFKIFYATCSIDCPVERDARLNFGVDYWAKIWLNGNLIFDNTELHNAAPIKDEYGIPVRLAAGKNEILVKVHSGSSGNGFWMSVTDPGDLSVITLKK